MPLREELEILIVKVVLKPAIILAKKIGPQNEYKKTASSSQLSNEGVNKRGLHDLSDEEDPAELYI